MQLANINFQESKPTHVKSKKKKGSTPLQNPPSPTASLPNGTAPIPVSSSHNPEISTVPVFNNTSSSVASSPYETDVVRVFVGSPGDGRSFFVHQGILNQSPSLRTKILSPAAIRESSSFLHDTDPTIFELVLRYLYTGDYQKYHHDSATSTYTDDIQSNAAKLFEMHSLLYCFSREYEIDELSSIVCRNIEDMIKVPYESVLDVAKKAYPKLPKQDDDMYREKFKHETRTAMKNNRSLFQEPWILDVFRTERGNLTVDLFMTLTEPLRRENEAEVEAETPDAKQKDSLVNSDQSYNAEESTNPSQSSKGKEKMVRWDDGPRSPSLEPTAAVFAELLPSSDPQEDIPASDTDPYDIYVKGSEPKVLETNIFKIIYGKDFPQIAPSTNTDDGIGYKCPELPPLEPEPKKISKKKRNMMRLLEEQEKREKAAAERKARKAARKAARKHINGTDTHAADDQLPPNPVPVGANGTPPSPLKRELEAEVLALAEELETEPRRPIDNLPATTQEEDSPINAFSLTETGMEPLPAPSPSLSPPQSADPDPDPEPEPEPITPQSPEFVNFPINNEEHNEENGAEGEEMWADAKYFMCPCSRRSKHLRHESDWINCVKCRRELQSVARQMTRMVGQDGERNCGVLV
ncbi:hypothetical protein AJ79_09997 [Helicocarpus griseus UAMH5409]|uniref:BTB domain-containing protein n=1 Tax=Helicocarpus griseus UAMH5409 TaxID=1447875 RepID=A0A2B7WG25_9EURO|nr:hypothetical protein AJ79_09997 [Helicocarpus griseus UAMH5409]